MPALARDFMVIAVDQRDRALRQAAGRYNSGTQANDLVALMDALGHKGFAVVASTPAWGSPMLWLRIIPSRFERLVVGEAITGVIPSPPLLVAGLLNTRLWHIAFNRLEALVRGRENIYFGAEYAQSAGTPLPDHVVKYYVDGLASSPDALRGSFGSYRAIDATIAQNAQRKTRRLSLPVLAIDGAKGLGEGTTSTMKLVADNVEGVIIPGSGTGSPRRLRSSCLRRWHSSWPRIATSRPRQNEIARTMIRVRGLLQDSRRLP